MKKTKLKPQKKYKLRYAYISEKDKQKLEEIKNKFKVSFSKIAAITANNLYNYINKLNYQYEKPKNSKIICLKPRWELEEIKTQELFTNSLHLFATKLEELNLEQEEKNKILNNIYKEFNKEKEIFWDLNNQLRTNKRAIEILKKNNKK